jgi:two-component sensor histidine kinase
LALAEALPEPLLLLHPSGDIVAANQRAWALLELADDKRRDASLSACVDQPKKLAAYLDQCGGSRRSVPGTVTLRTRGGRQVECHCDGALLEAASDEAPALILLRCRECSEASDTFANLTSKLRQLDAEVHQHERTRANLERALREKDALVSELHHRVKNNLQILLSIVGLAARDETDPRTQRRLMETRNRVLSMAVVQKLLYQSESFAVVDGAGLVAELSNEVRKSFGRENIELSVETMPVTVSMQAAAPFGLIVNELLSNALRHAFPEDTPGRVAVRLRRTPGGEIELSVADNGRGLPQIATRRLSAGLNLARGLANQLGGELAIETDGGTRCVLRFGDSVAAPGHVAAGAVALKSR